jgi:hypothetical protein
MNVPLAMFAVIFLLSVPLAIVRVKPCVPESLPELACLTKITAGSAYTSQECFSFYARKKWKSLILFCGVWQFSIFWMLHNLYFLHGCS